MKFTIGLGLYPLIFIIIFIKRYLAGIVLDDIYTWISIAIASFFWWVGITVALIIVILLVAIIATVDK